MVIPKKIIFGQCFVSASDFPGLGCLERTEVSRLRVPPGADSPVVRGQKLLVGSAEAKWTQGRKPGEERLGRP